MVLKVAVLVDLPREKGAGGHVKYWERIAEACASDNLPVDLTIYFSGNRPEVALSSNVRFRSLPPIFSTANLKFLPYVPAHTDLASHHPGLAQELGGYNVIHTTDAYFAFARTAERIAKKQNIPLVTSLHTDTPAYAELFTRHTLQKIFGVAFGNGLDKTFRLSTRQRQSKQKRLETHLSACSAAFILRPEDKHLAQTILAPEKIHPMRLGVNKNLFKPDPAARSSIESEYAIPPEKFLALFVGRVDEGKNAHLLSQACAEALNQSVNLHLIVAGQGPLTARIKHQLGPNVTLTGFVNAEKLAKLYAAADCLCMASDIEIGGLVGVEALASGCPVLVSKQSGIASLYGNPPALKEVDSTAKAWSAALGFLSKHLALQTQMREAASIFREKNLATWSELVKEDFLPVWQSVNKENP